MAVDIQKRNARLAAMKRAAAKAPREGSREEEAAETPKEEADEEERGER